MRKLILLPFLFIIKDSFTDQRDNTKYSLMHINNDTWLKENLKYLSNDSTSTIKLEDYYEKFGTYYTYRAAFKACPEDYKLATYANFQELLDQVNGHTDSLGKKRVNKKTLEKHGLELGGITRGKKVSYSDIIGFYWTRSDTLLKSQDSIDQKMERHVIAIHIFKEENSELYNIEPSILPENIKDSSVAINCKCVRQKLKE